MAVRFKGIPIKAKTESYCVMIVMFYKFKCACSGKKNCASDF